MRTITGGEGVRLTVTRKGIEIVGWYDHFVGMEPIEVPWAELDAMRERVREGRPRTDGQG